MSKLFIDIFTQKGFVENFGSHAIEHCPEIRENLMDVTSLAIRHKIPILAFMYTGFSEADFEKVADTETEDFGYEKNHLQRLIKIEQLNFEDFELEQDYSETTIFIYGVPLESAVLNFYTKFASKFKKCWIIQDAVKSSNPNTDELVLEQLKAAGAKFITTRNLEKFINM